MNRLVFPLLVGGMVCFHHTAQAQDIVNILSDQANRTYTAAGESVDIKFRLYSNDGNFTLTNSGGGTVALYPTLRLVVNGDVAWANLVSWSAVSPYKTDVIFRYTVRPGDMASPLRIYGAAGSGGTAGEPYQFYWNGWAIANQATGSNAVWQVNIPFIESGFGTAEKYLDFSAQKINIRTLSFPQGNLASLAASESTTWQVTTVDATQNAVAMHIWTPGTNIVQIGTVANQTDLGLTMPMGSTNVSFNVTGLAVGSANIYAMREQDYQAFVNGTNFTAALTNYIVKAITVTAPPEPSVSVLMTATGTDNVTLIETNAFNTGSLKIHLSETFTNAVDVQLISSASNVTFGLSHATSTVVTVAANQYDSSEVKFNVRDGDATIEILPTISAPAAAAAKYTNKKSAIVYIQNAKPTLSANYTPPATRGVPCTFSWTALDVAADLASGMIVTWNFNGEAITNLIGATGSLQYTFSSTGTKTIRATVADKDGLVSDEVQFTIDVNTPTPKPSVRVVPSATEYNETTTNSTGSVMVYLSESYSEDVWIKLTTFLQGNSQSNILFSTTNAIRIATGSTNSAPILFSIPDGTLESSIYGIDIVPSVTNEPAKSYYTDLRTATVIVKNVNPTVTKPVARDISLVPLPQYTNVPMGRAFAFDYTVKDVAADTSSMEVTWRFGDGTGDVVVTGAVGSVTHTFASLGAKYVWMQAKDKDGGYSDEIEFPITVVSPPSDPTVRILSPASALSETTIPKTGQFIVQLSEAFTNVVTVGLTVSPVTNAANGVIVLSTNRVVFALGETEKTVYISPRDGTDNSWLTGFEIIPTVLGNAAATNYFKEVSSGHVEVINVAPTIITPRATDITTTDILYTVPQGSPWTFTWVANDVPDDMRSSPLGSAMTVTWYFGDGTVTNGYGGSGMVAHTYTTTGDIVVRVVVTDKDGGTSEVQFKITVKPSKEVMVTPIGPNIESAYYGAQGLGNGMVYSEQARTPVANRNNVYFFMYDPSVTSATLEAIPYKTGAPGYYNLTNYTSSGTAVVNMTNTLFDSFFFVWVGTDQGLSDDALDPLHTSSSTVIGLPDATADTASIEIRNVQAIFSREWRIADNMGDINLDGIPDKIALSIESANGSTAGAGNLPPGLSNLSGYNQDVDDTGTAVGDYLPVNPTGAQGRFDFRPVADGKGGNNFTAYLEVRGYDPGLNKVGVSDLDVVLDEPGTDPTVEDSDGDGFPDGWEYYFWYQATINKMAGSAYNPLDVSVGTPLDWKVIALAFQPTVQSTEGANIRDLDKDGLTDIEEMVIGTNPTRWDTDGDGICDTWEVMRSMDPCSPADGGTAVNPDGDFMAYATVSREMVTADDGITYLSDTPIAAGDNLLVSGANFTTVYHYGDSNALFAAGYDLIPPVSAIAVADSVAVNVLLMHYQVYREFGFDPRTAWTGAINRKAYPTRFPAWLADPVRTKAFTSLDEYLLLKFMSETRMNGATASMAATYAVWRRFSTDPLTPDSDVTVLDQDGMPDGWELYVSVNPEADLTIPANRVMGISPWNALDGDLDHPITTTPPRDGLINRREFAGTDSSAAYVNAAQYSSSNFLGVVSIVQPALNVAWLNKFWPTDPWAPDTDGDGLDDLAERTFMYGTVTDNGTTCIQGAGLNPNSMDTDLDALPDAWEFEYAGTLPTAAGTYSGIVITNGMDGTVLDFDQDWDLDGLLNYEEYWTQAVRGFRYDITAAGTFNMFGVPGQPTDATFEPASLFTEITNPWDRARFPWGDAGPVLHVLLPLVNVYDTVNKNYLYATTDPRDYDTDLDGMDDYYEMYHGLNPLLGDPVNSDDVIPIDGDRVARACMINGALTVTYHYNEWNTSPDPLPLDFVNYPWMTGLPEADPDSDGLRNLEEKLQPNTAAPPYSNTDPSPLWFTDDSNTNSATARFYHPMGYAVFQAGLMAYNDSNVMFYWPPLPVIPPAFVYSFERNEGYDTDNDGLSDKAEMVNSRNSLTDPQDFDDPVRRQAMWFSGTNSAASATRSFTFGEWALRSFTAELWACPTVTNREQVLLERVLSYSPSDLSTPDQVIRRNFRIGIAADGRVYGMFDNAGAHDEHTATVYAYGNKLTPNQWVHIAVRMDGANSAFTILVNGEVRNAVSTTLIPANGLLIVRNDSNYPTLDYSYTILAGGVRVGAADINPAGLTSQVWEDYAQFYEGYIDEIRIWDGARSNDEILSNYKKRFTKSDLWANRLLVRTEEAKGYTRIWTNPLQLSAELLYHYTFDNIFGADSTNSVATSPRGFNDPAATTNRPLDATVGWWAGSEVKSMVYTDYQCLPWIENSVTHMPIFGSATLNQDDTVTVLMTNAVANSVYWTHSSAGATAGDFSFPNSNNPYDTSSDLLPLGDAFAKQATEMWDEQGASGVWSETATDGDSDGLPDWWELYVAGDTTSVAWNAVNPTTGMTYGERYQRDIANGMTPDNNPVTNPGGWTVTDSNSDGMNDSATANVGNPVVIQTADSDGDGMPDWWENIYNLDPACDTGCEGAQGDPDRDGLSNLSEYMISEVYKFRYLNPRQFKTDATQAVSDYYLPQGSLTLGAMFTDHDYMEDTWEDQFDPYYVSRNVYDPSIDADEDGWSNWAESRYRVYADGTRPDLSMQTEVLNLMDYEFPIPTIETTIRYKGVQDGGSIILETYTTPDMSGEPDATFNIPNNSAAVTVKTQSIGYWDDKTVYGLLSPGSIQPGSISFRFTDLWTDMSADTGFDVNGILYAGAVSGVSTPIGTIDYVTGRFELNLAYYKNRIIMLADQIQTRQDYIDCELSFIQMSYSVRAINAWPKKVYLGVADAGYVREGTNYVFAFMDLDGSGTWNPGEPNGVTTPMATDVGWDYNWFNIELTDYTPGYLRMNLAGVRSEDVLSGMATTAGGVNTAAALQHRVRIRRTIVDGLASYSRTVVEKTLSWPRDYLHEGDVLAQGEFGLDWGLNGVPTNMSRTVVVYDVSIADATTPLTNNLVFTSVATFTNRFETTRAQAQATSPISGKYVYSARPTFKWTMPDGYTAFAIEIKKGSPSGATVYQSGTVQAPVRDSITGEYVWEAPIHAGDKLMNGEVFASNTLYAWHVIALNSKFTLTPALGISALPVTWSSWNVFRLDVNAPAQSSGYGELRATVKYYGPARSNLTDRVKVQVFRTAGFTGVPEAQYTLLSATELGILTNSATSGTNAVLRGLTPSTSAGHYYVRAYIDYNQNGVHDAWESWGYANYYGLTDTPYSAKPSDVTVSASTAVITVIIEDADTDQDWFPDAWEYERHPGDPDFLKATGPTEGLNGIGDLEINPKLLVNVPFAQQAIMMILATGTSDQDADGVGDLAELVLGTDAVSASTAGDGYTDGEKMSIGLSGADTLALGVTDFNVSGFIADMKWQVEVQKDASVNRTFLSEITGVASDGPVTYHIEYTPSLLAATWTDVGSGSVTLDGVKTVNDVIDTQSVIDPAKGFFRIRLSK